MMFADIISKLRRYWTYGLYLLRKVVHVLWKNLDQRLIMMT